MTKPASSSAYNPLHEKGHGATTGKTEASGTHRGDEADFLVLVPEDTGRTREAECGHSALEYEAGKSAGAVKRFKIYHHETGAKETHAPLNISPLSTPTSFFLVQFLRRWWWSSRLRVLLPEIRTLACRMGWILEIRAWEMRGHRRPIPSIVGLAEGLQARKAKHACIPYMQQIQTRYPSLTIVDLFLVEQGWLAGWELGVRTYIAQNKNSSTYPDSGNSMPREVTQQSTIHGSSTPLPSRE